MSKCGARPTCVLHGPVVPGLRCCPFITDSLPSVGVVVQLHNPAFSIINKHCPIEVDRALIHSVMWKAPIQVEVLVMRHKSGPGTLRGITLHRHSLSEGAGRMLVYLTLKPNL